MYFILSKVAGFLQLSTALIALGFVGVVLTWSRFARAGRRVMTVSLALLAIAGLSPIGNVLLLPLEQRFPPWVVAGQDPVAGIIVLGGALDEVVTSRRGAPSLNDAAERITTAVALARQFPDARLVFSGGSAALFATDAKEADAAALIFRELGVAPERIETESRSRNTVENARFAKQHANPQPGERWLLVTSAYHMPRSIGVFRTVGFAVEPYPVDWRTSGPDSMLRPFRTLSEGLRMTDVAVREWIGLLIYRLAGYTQELFPAPARVAGCDATPMHGACRR